MSETPTAGPSNRLGITLGAVTGVAGVPISYMLLRAFGIIISDELLWVCVIAPTALWLVAALIGRFRPWLLRALIASAIATVILLVVVLGGISLIAGMLSDPRP